MKKPPAVEVIWIDARDKFDCAITHDEAMKFGLIERTHIGYLVSADKDVVRLCHGMDEDGYDNLTAIPAGWVKEIRYFGKPRKPKEAPREGKTESSA